MPLFVLLQDPSTTAEKQHSLNHPVHFSLTFRLQNFFFKMARIILTGAPGKNTAICMLTNPKLDGAWLQLISYYLILKVQGGGV